jgi:hypothetical protein
MVGPIFFTDNARIQDRYFQSILLALLARLKQQQSKNIHTHHPDDNMNRLNNLVLQYISHSGEGPSDSISLMYSNLT